MGEVLWEGIRLLWQLLTGSVSAGERDASGSAAGEDIPKALAYAAWRLEEREIPSGLNLEPTFRTPLP